MRDQANLALKKHSLIPCRLLIKAIGLSMRPNDTLVQSRTNKPKSLNPTCYQVVAYLMLGKEGVPYPTHINKLLLSKNEFAFDSSVLLISLVN